MGAYGYAAGHTPSLDALAAASIRFDRCYAHSSMTVPSMASLFTGLVSAEHGIYANGAALEDDFPTLTTAMREAGFATGAFIGSYALRPGRGFDRDFDTYTEEYGSEELMRKHPENLAAPLTDAAIEWVTARDPDERLFLWVHYQEPHGPYTPLHFDTPEFDRTQRAIPRGTSNSGRGAIPRYQWLGHGRLAEYEARYDAEISDFDAELGRLMSTLDELGILERSAVVLTSDHGEAFGEDNLFCAHGEGLSETLLHVPLLLRAPGQPPGVRTDRVRLMDVAVTILELLGLDSGNLGGTTLLRDEGDRRLLAAVRSIGQGRYRSLRDGAYELTQRRGDPPELHVSPGAPPATQALRDRLAEELERDAPWPPLHPAAMLSADERKALRALGYID